MIPEPRLAHIVEFVVKDPLNVDDRAKQAFVELIDHGPSGRLEANRILFHMLKDNEFKEWNSGPSGYMVNCVNEAQTALLNWRAWDECPEHLKNRGKGKGKGKDKGKDNSGPSDSSSGPGHRGFR